MESKGEQGEKERETEFITYSSGIPLDLPAFLLHLLLLRICFIYISYFSLVCPPSRDHHEKQRFPGFAQGDHGIPTRSTGGRKGIFFPLLLFSPSPPISTFDSTSPSLPFSLESPGEYRESLEEYSGKSGHGAVLNEPDHSMESKRQPSVLLD